MFLLKRFFHFQFLLLVHKVSQMFHRHQFHRHQVVPCELLTRDTLAGGDDLITG